MSTLLEQIRALPVDEQVALANEILARTEDDDYDPDFHAEIRRRIQEHDADPGSAVSWETVKQQCGLIAA
ncbi:MAG TPA: hypothetical protein DIT64_03785 [Verrucomicrobiales bacterium]|nr:hypothetical protein [Verrucomicrobiales bacterium]